MRHQLRLLAIVLASLLFVSAGGPSLNAQIMNDIRAHIDHDFIVGNTTLPPGEYTFRMMRESDLTVMTAANESEKIRVEFVVRTTIDDHTPAHSELVFRKYGNTEFLSKIFEGGSKTGAEVTETNREEVRLVKHMQRPAEHIEEQK